MNRFNSKKLALLLGVVPLVSAYLIEPPTTAASNTIQDCSAWHVAASGDLCTKITDDNWITVEQFQSYNPSVTSACTLVTGNSYCVEQNWGIPVPVVTPTPTPVVTTSKAVSPAPTSIKPSPTNGVTTPSPVQSGLVSNCDAFHLVTDNDSCWDLSQKYAITLDQFYAWNPAVGSSCQALWAKNYVCVSIIGVDPVKTTLITTAKPTSSFVIPPPCVFDVKKGEYVCSPATATTTKPTTTKPANGVTTPTPFQAGMTANCKKFYKVARGDGCWAIADANKIALDNFYKWNPAVGTNCGALWPDNYVCVGL